jgi:carbamoyltransferase
MNKITLAVSRVHNSAVALFDGDDLIFHIENERLSNIKYDSFPLHAILKIKDYVDHIDQLVLAGVSRTLPFESFSNIDVYSSIVLGLGESFRANGFKRYDLWNQHHRLHAVCAFYNSGFESALCVIKDGMGSDVELVGNEFQNGTIGRELGTSFLFKNNNSIDVVDRHIGVAFELPHEPYYIDQHTYLSTTFSEGLAFQKTAIQFGFHELDAGKVMGMASYGNGSNYKIYKNNLINKEIFSYKNNDLRCGELLLENLSTFEEQSNFAHDLQFQIQEQVSEYILNLINKTGEKNLCLSGGFFLNCMSNYHLLKKLPKDVNIYVEPNSSDAGTAIGAGLTIINPGKNKKQKSLYLGPVNNFDIEKIKKKYSKNTFKSVTINEVATALSEKKVVAMFQGRSEVGPRALGNRSILYDPRDPNGKDRINEIKKREWFRPFAGTVLLDHCDQWVDLKCLKESEFMMYAVDGSCRIQTLSKDQNKNFYDLLNEFNKLTGVPILLNTSFNLAGDCIVETIDNAIDTLNKSNIDLLYLPEYQLIVEK